jgi:hypothetical protein
MKKVFLSIILVLTIQAQANEMAPVNSTAFTSAEGAPQDSDKLCGKLSSSSSGPRKKYFIDNSSGSHELSVIASSASNLDFKVNRLIGQSVCVSGSPSILEPGKFQVADIARDNGQPSCKDGTTKENGIDPAPCTCRRGAWICPR